MTVPLARQGGMTQWVLVDKNLYRDQRQILASCESFRKRSLTSDSEGRVLDGITHGIASVYVVPEHRGRGYASRLLRELDKCFPNFQVEANETVIASVLFSDIGKSFYTKLGWRAFTSHHLEFEPEHIASTTSRPISADQLAELCADDEAIMRRALTEPRHSNNKTRFAILPDLDHMGWHHSKEEFVAQRLFGKPVPVKGAIAGPPGNRVWAIWTHRWYGKPDEKESGNTLYILRFVIEDLSGMAAEGGALHNAQLVANVKAVIQEAQSEAAAWNLTHVSMWEPSDFIRNAMEQTGIGHKSVDREDEGICSLRWYGSGSGDEDSVEWIANEKYGWC